MGEEIAKVQTFTPTGISTTRLVGTAPFLF
jgi:hypothetical protein